MILPSPRPIGALLLNSCDFCAGPLHFCKKCRLLSSSTDEKTKSSGGGGGGERSLASTIFPAGLNVNFGWVVCSCQECLNQVVHAKQQFCYPLSKLQQEFGDAFQVKRSSGQVEQGRWKFIEDGTWNQARDKVLVRIQATSATTQKTVLLSDLRQWQGEKPLRE